MSLGSQALDCFKKKTFSILEGVRQGDDFIFPGFRSLFIFEGVRRGDM